MTRPNSIFLQTKIIADADQFNQTVTEKLHGQETRLNCAAIKIQKIKNDSHHRNKKLSNVIAQRQQTRKDREKIYNDKLAQIKGEQFQNGMVLGVGLTVSCIVLTYLSIVRNKK